MRILLRLLLFHGLVWLCYLPSAEAQPLPSHSGLLISALQQAGFENIGVREQPNDLTIFYENRRYRSENEALAVVRKIAANLYGSETSLHLVPLFNRIAVTVVSFPALSKDTTARRILPEASVSTDPFTPFRKSLKLQNSSLRRIDLILLPGIRTQFGNFEKPVEWQGSISPILQTSLWRGNLLTAQLLIPFHNSLQQKFESKVRLESATIAQLWRLPRNTLVHVTGGLLPFPISIYAMFYLQRYGIHTEMRKYFLNARLAGGGSLSYTGLVHLGEGYINYYAFNQLNWTIYGEYREPTYDLTTRLTAGKFLYNDLAVRFDLSRQFSEITVGVFAVKSTLATIGGIQLSVPISPRRSPKPSAFRVRMARYFNWEFRESTLEPVATSLKVNNEWNETFRNLNPDFVRNHLK